MHTIYVTNLVSHRPSKSSTLQLFFHNYSNTGPLSSAAQPVSCPMKGRHSCSSSLRVNLLALQRAGSTAKCEFAANTFFQLFRWTRLLCCCRNTILAHLQPQLYFISTCGTPFLLQPCREQPLN